MSFVRRHAVPLAAALAAAAAAFAVVVLTTDDVDAPRAHEGGAAAADSGLALYYRMGCGSCHELAAAGSVGPIGPNLDDVLPAHTRESLIAAILQPPPESVMPQGFGERMTDEQLDTLVGFLLASR